MKRVKATRAKKISWAATIIFKVTNLNSEWFSLYIMVLFYNRNLLTLLASFSLNKIRLTIKSASSIIFSKVSMLFLLKRPTTWMKKVEISWNIKSQCQPKRRINEFSDGSRAPSCTLKKIIQTQNIHKTTIQSKSKHFTATSPVLRFNRNVMIPKNLRTL